MQRPGSSNVERTGRLGDEWKDEKPAYGGDCEDEHDRLDHGAAWIQIIDARGIRGRTHRHRHDRDVGRKPYRLSALQQQPAHHQVNQGGERFGDDPVPGEMGWAQV
jgi:hypothetical protein